MHDIPEQLLGAVKLFLQEFTAHLSFFNTVTSSHQQDPNRWESLSAEQIAKERRVLEHRFHTIKGSAGFFKLTAIRDTAAEGEKVFRTAVQASALREAVSAVLPRLIADLTQQFEELSREYPQIP